jgi:energy-coupling factor transporter transmembrane protein EcfT
MQPPALPASSHVNDFVIHLLPSQFKVWLLEQFPRFELKMGEIPMEETAGLGLGVITCFVLWIFKGRRSLISLLVLRRQPWFFLGIAGLISLLFFMAKMGSESTARLLLPYYPFLLLLPLGFWSLPSVQARKLAPLFSLLCATGLVGLILSPARPLFPVHKFLTLMGDSPRFARVSAVYQAYLQRGTCWDPILTILPPDIKTLGFFSHGDDLEAPLWKPYGLRKIVSTGEKDITASGIPHADAWLARRPIAEFLKSNPKWQIHWKEIGAQSITQKASVGGEEWAVFLPR